MLQIQWWYLKLCDSTSDLGKINTKYLACCTVHCPIIICFSLLLYNYCTYCLIFFVLLFCVLFSILCGLCFYIVLCIVSPSVYIAVSFLFFHKLTDQRYRMEIQLQQISIVSNRIEITIRTFCCRCLHCTSYSVLVSSTAAGQC